MRHLIRFLSLLVTAVAIPLGALAAQQREPLAHHGAGQQPTVQAIGTGATGNPLIYNGIGYRPSVEATAGPKGDPITHRHQPDLAAVPGSPKPAIAPRGDAANPLTHEGLGSHPAPAPANATTQRPAAPSTPLTHRP